MCSENVAGLFGTSASSYQKIGSSLPTTSVAEMLFWKTLSFTLLLTLMTEVQYAEGNCDITSVTSPAAYSLNVKWIAFPGCTNYLMELRAINPASVIPVVLYLTASTTEKLVQGLKPGSVYQVTLKVYQFNYLVCINSKIAQTVPATSQITFFKAISSTTITFQWSSAMGASAYVLVVEGAYHNEYHNMTYKSLTGEMIALQPAKIYNCYVYSSNPAGLGEKSSVKKVNTLFSPPAIVNVTAVNDSTVLVTWSSVSSVVFYQVTLTEDNQPDLPPISWNSSVTYIRIPNLKPCLSYTIGVSAVNLFLQPGEINNVPYTTTSISKVSSISGNYNCKSGAATITWEPVHGAYSYRAVATGRTGATFTCTSSSTSCRISTLECGEHYNVEITAIGNCESTSDLSYSFETVPCPPEDLDFGYECFSNKIKFSWGPTNKTDYYIATAVDSDGVVKECHTMFTYCYFTHADCGHSYSFTVRSVYSDGQGCVPMSSMPLTMSTAPCPPKNFHSTSLDCYSGVLIHTWDPAPGALSYTVQARGNQDDILNCTSQNTSCEMTDVKCGQSISVWITASNDNCTTEPMLVDQTETVPCAPQYVSVVNTCNLFSVTLSWLASNDAIFYMAKAVNSGGLVNYCSTMDTQCEIQGLQCGQSYEAFVTSSNFFCNSTESQHVTAYTAPCAPVNVEVVKDCRTKTVTLLWEGWQAGSLYFALLEDNEGNSVNCSTTENSCNFYSLPCGMMYNITVTNNDTYCSSLPSRTIQMESIPCAPEQVLAEVNCVSGVMIVEWNSSDMEANFTAVVKSEQGETAYCTSSEHFCSVEGMECGKNYSVVVITTSGTCQSDLSKQILVGQAYCKVLNISTSVNCSTNIATVTWQSSQDGGLYLVIARSNSGELANCTSTSTSCDLSSLECGITYMVTVNITSRNCTSIKSAPVQLQTAPCQPVNLSVNLNCGNTNALLSWDTQNRARNYIGSAQTTNSPTLYCITTNTSCSLEGLNCSAVYNFTVLASNEWCNSSNSKALSGGKVPCSPAGLHVIPSVVENHNQLLKVNWSAIECPDSLYLLEVLESVETLFQLSSYWTERTYFEKPVPCSSAYNTSVRAQNSGRISAPSAIVTGITAPCPPQSVTFSGTYSSALVSWDASPYAAMYHVYKVINFGRTEVCYTSQLSCMVTNTSSDLIIVTASNEAGESQATNVRAVRRKRDLKQTHTEELSSLQLSLTRVTADSLWLDWSPVEGIEFYTLRIQEQSHLQSPEPIILNVYGEAAVVSALKMATTYCITLSTSNSSSGQISSRPENLCVQTSTLSEAGVGGNKSNL